MSSCNYFTSTSCNANAYCSWCGYTDECLSISSSVSCSSSTIDPNLPTFVIVIIAIGSVVWFIVVISCIVWCRRRSVMVINQVPGGYPPYQVVPALGTPLYNGLPPQYGLPYQAPPQYGQPCQVPPQPYQAPPQPYQAPPQPYQAPPQPYQAPPQPCQAPLQPAPPPQQ